MNEKIYDNISQSSWPVSFKGDNGIMLIKFYDFTKNIEIFVVKSNNSNNEIVVNGLPGESVSASVINKCKDYILRCDYE